MFLVYVLENETNHKIYIGQTADLETRLNRHNGLLVTKKKSYTSINKQNGNWIVIYTEEYNTRHEALHREKYLKSHVGRDWLKQKMIR